VEHLEASSGASRGEAVRVKQERKWWCIVDR